MDGNDLIIGRIAGIEVRVNWSVLIIAALLTWSMAAVVLPEQVPSAPPRARWVGGAVAALGLLGAILAHELGHAVVARRHGVNVERITLWLFGGVAQLTGEAPTPGAEARIAFVGPAISMILAIGLGLAAAAAEAAGAAPILVAVVWWLAGINGVLAVFNLVPGAPLDGGRLLHAFLWRRHGDPVRATVQASRAGVVVGHTLVGLGFVQLLVFGNLGGLWTALIGWFLASAAVEESTATITRAALRNLRVADIMTWHPEVAPDWITVDEFIDRHVLRSRHSTFPLHDFDGRLSGLVTLAALKQVPPERRAEIRVRDVAEPIDQVCRAHPDEPVVDLVERLAARPGTPRRALVFDRNGELVGIVTSSDLAAAVERGVLVKGLRPR